MDPLDALFQDLAVPEDDEATAAAVGDAVLGSLDQRPMPTAFDLIEDDDARPELRLLLRRLIFGDERLTAEERETASTLSLTIAKAYGMIAQQSQLPRLPECWEEHLETVVGAVGVIMTVRALMGATKAFELSNLDTYLSICSQRILVIANRCASGHVTTPAAADGHPFPSVHL